MLTVGITTSLVETPLTCSAVEFRMTVFRPFRGEIIYGRIKSSNEEGIILDLEFTSEVFVPYQNLPENSSFSKAEMVWIWNSEGTELFFDKGEPVLFRVEHEEWYDQRPTIIEKDEKGEIIEERPTAWKIIVSCVLSAFEIASNVRSRAPWLNLVLVRLYGGPKAERKKRVKRAMSKWRAPRNDCFQPANICRLPKYPITTHNQLDPSVYLHFVSVGSRQSFAVRVITTIVISFPEPSECLLTFGSL